MLIQWETTREMEEKKIPKNWKIVKWQTIMERTRGISDETKRLELRNGISEMRYSVAEKKYMKTKYFHTSVETEAWERCFEPLTDNIGKKLYSVHVIISFIRKFVNISFLVDAHRPSTHSHTRALQIQMENGFSCMRR